MVAGLYLNFFDEAFKARQSLKKNSLNLNQVTHALKQTTKDLKDTEQLNNSLPYDPDRFHKQQSLEQRVKVLTESIKQYKNLIAPLKQSQKVHEQKARDLKKRILKVFRFEKRDASKFGHPFYITWQHNCPDWRVSCPLPRQHASDLLQIWKESPPEICRRYSQILY